ncbi:MAG: RraA family protein [Aggregatilineales bacterium]
MTQWNSDKELFELGRRELYTAVVGDICDQIGLRHQFLSPQIRPLEPPGQCQVMIGRAMTVLEADVFSEPEGNHPFGQMLVALDDLQQDEVYICAGSSPRYALVGELMCIAMRSRGAVGAVCDGYIRDCQRIFEMSYPVFSLGPYAQDQRGRGMVIDFRVTIEINNVVIHPGDVIMGDIDGVLVVPSDAVEEVFTQALTKVRGENIARDALLNGLTASEVFTKHGIL